MNTGNLIPCPVTENDKHRILGDLIADMNVFLKARSDLLFSGERAAYYAALNEYIKAGLYIIAKEYATIYDLAPIDH